MALHRDIFWVGKQWAVTGYGMQAVDQKQKSKFDIEASRLWEDDLLENLSGERWFNPDDFTAGLSVARARYPEAPEKAALREKAAPKAVSAPAAPLTPPAAKAEAKVEANVEANADLKPAPAPGTVAKATLEAEPLKVETASAKLVEAQAGATPAKPAPNVEPAKPSAAPSPPAKPAFTPAHAQSPIKVKARGEKKRPPAQLSMRVGNWPAKFTRMWRVRINRK